MNFPGSKAPVSFEIFQLSTIMQKIRKKLMRESSMVLQFFEKNLSSEVGLLENSVLECHFFGLPILPIF